MLGKKTIKDVDLRGKRVLVRLDLNTPLKIDGVHVEVENSYRIIKSLQTLKYLVDQECIIFVIAHLGRPGGEYKGELSLEPVAKELSTMIDGVKFIPDLLGSKARIAADNAKEGQIIVLENLRFHPAETENSKTFGKDLVLVTRPNTFVQDAFGVIHRSHTSTDAITKLVPSVAGLLVEDEIKNLSKVTDNAPENSVLVLGGAKVHTKIKLINNLADKVSKIVIGGVMANTFLKASGIDIGRSVYDKDYVDEAMELMKELEEKGVEVLLPLRDVVVANSVNVHAHEKVVNTMSVGNREYILDYGPESTAMIDEFLKGSRLILWNGPIGYVEFDQFQRGSRQVARSMLSKEEIVTIVGGGDTADFINDLGKMDEFDHVSTGGGSSMTFLAGDKLPGLDGLLER